MNGLRKTDEDYCFKPFSHSWVAIHPHPQGIIQFVGSFFLFGSLPTIFYSALLKSLYQQRYTIIAYPSSVLPPLRWKSKLVDHWSASIQLLKEEYAIKTELVAHILNCTITNRDSLNVYLDHSNYFWLGHSLGCKYISLLEILSDGTQDITHYLRQCGLTKRQSNMVGEDLQNIELERINSDRQIELLLAQNKISRSVSSRKFILDQPAIFLAAEIYGTEERNGKPTSAIPFFDLFPDGKTTICLIDHSQNLFNLTALIAFRFDRISKDDVKALKNVLSSRSSDFISKLFPGYNLKLDRLSSLCSHLKPLIDNNEFLADCIADIFNELKNRTIGDHKPQSVPCDLKSDS